MGCTTALSSLSDWICGPLVAQTARRYADIIYTPEHFVEMLFWIEDKRFSIHFGVDPIAVARALVFNLRGGALQGASTIAQQIYNIRIRRSRKVTRSWAHKVRQAGWSLCHSAAKSKASILKEYVDTVYWGRSYNGLDNAVAGYFKATRDSLSAAQSFFLAERIAAPNRVSVPRISNLLKRTPIRLNLARNGSTPADVAGIYERVYGCGGEVWQVLAK
jgi:membrane peptidoglycan carboxypeptidase